MLRSSCKKLDSLFTCTASLKNLKQVAVVVRPEWDAGVVAHGAEGGGADGRGGEKLAVAGHQHPLGGAAGNGAVGRRADADPIQVVMGGLLDEDRQQVDVPVARLSGLGQAGGSFCMLFGTTTQSIYHMGPKTGASADGRRAQEVLAASVNPINGRNVSGLTAELNSVAAIDYSKAAGGASYITDVHPGLIDEEECLGKMCAALRAFFERGGMEIGLNVLREEQLRDAQAEPEKNAHIMVRVFGFSTQFVSLEPEWQEYVMSRLRHQG